MTIKTELSFRPQGEIFRRFRIPLGATNLYAQLGRIFPSQNLTTGWSTAQGEDYTEPDSTAAIRQIDNNGDRR